MPKHPLELDELKPQLIRDVEMEIVWAAQRYAEDCHDKRAKVLILDLTKIIYACRDRSDGIYADLQKAEAQTMRARQGEAAVIQKYNQDMGFQPKQPWYKRILKKWKKNQ